MCLGLVAYLAVQAVKFMPTAVSYLASFISNEEGAGVTVAVETAPDEDLAGDTDTIYQEEFPEAEDSAEMEDFAETDEENIESVPAVSPRPIFIIPTSNPDGFVDLSVSYLGAGYLVNNRTLYRRAAIDNNWRSGVKFAVKNTGTKTSGEWAFFATLPSGQQNPVAARQAPLKPNERALSLIHISEPTSEPTRPY